MSRRVISVPFPRRHLLGAGAAALAVPTLWGIRPSYAANRPIRIGLVSPQTGPLSSFGETDSFVVAGVRKALADGLQSGGRRWPVEILVRDSQSSPTRAADVATELMQRAKVDVILASGGPDTVNPVADQAEVNGTPCITTADPWQDYFFGRHGNPATGFAWTYHFCFGLEDVVQAFLGLWDTLPTNKMVGALFANDADGNAWADPVHGFPPSLPKSGYHLVDPGHYQDLTQDFTAQITAFKSAGVEIVTGAMLPPDFATFWAQAAQQGFHPKIVTVGKALLFPATVAALGERAVGLSSEVPWSAAFPFKSGLTGQSAAQLTQDYVQATGRRPSTLLGVQHAVFEVAVDVLRRAKSPEDPEAIIAAVKATNYKSIAGPIDWTTGPMKNICKTPLVAGQWTKTSDGLQLLIAENAGQPEIPVQTSLKPI